MMSFRTRTYDVQYTNMKIIIKLVTDYVCETSDTGTNAFAQDVQGPDRMARLLEEHPK